MWFWLFAAVWIVDEMGGGGKQKGFFERPL